MSETKHITLIMTGAGAPGAAGIISCLRKANWINLVVADANPAALGQYLSQPFEQIPAAGDPDFIPALLALCEKHKADVLMPLVTRELNPLAENLHGFKAIGTAVMVSDRYSLEIANNKSKLLQHLKNMNIEVPDFRIVHTVEEFTRAVRELGYPHQPVCFKPSVSNGSRGFRVIDESKDEFRLLFEEKPDATYISLEKATHILSQRKFPELLVCEYLPGAEYSVDCIANRGEVLLAVPRKRVKMLGGISVQGIIEDHTAIRAYCHQVIQALGLHGNIGIQVKESREGIYKILEINPRVQGTIVASLGAGVNLPLLAVKQELRLPITSDELKVNWNTAFSRYWAEVYYPAPEN